MGSIIWKNDVKKSVIHKVKCGGRTTPIGAGTPFNAKGEIANDGTAIGISAEESVYPHRCCIDLIVGGCVDERKRLAQSGIELTDECKAALKNIIFVDNDDMGSAFGGGSWNDLKDKPFYTEMAEVNFAVSANVPVFLPKFPTFAVGDTVIVKVNGVEHTFIAFDDGGQPSIGDCYADLQAGVGSFGWILSPQDGGAVVFALNGCAFSYMVESTHKLDAKYVPTRLHIGIGIVENDDGEWVDFKPFILNEDVDGWEKVSVENLCERILDLGFMPQITITTFSYWGDGFYGNHKNYDLAHVDRAEVGEYIDVILCGVTLCDNTERVSIWLCGERGDETKDYVDSFAVFEMPNGGWTEVYRYRAPVS